MEYSTRTKRVISYRSTYFLKPIIVNKEQEEIAMRNHIAVAAATLLLCSVTQIALAADNPVNAGSDKIKMTLYGQVNRGVLMVDDGDKTKTYFVDNKASSTRLGIEAESRTEGDLSFGSKFEVEMQSDSSGDVNRTNNAGVGGASFTERHMDIYAQHKTFGKLSLGQGDTASNGTAEVDLSGTALAGYSDVPTFAGSQLFWNKDTDKLSTLKIKDVVSNLDGLSRKDRLRYDTPRIAGFNLSCSLVEGSASDVALRYADKFSGLKIEAAVSNAYEGTQKKTEINAGSLSVLADMGVSLTVAAGQNKLDQTGREDPSYTYGKVGYQAKFSDLGKTAFSVDYGVFNDFKADGNKATVFGVQVVQKLDMYGAELYAGYRNHKLDSKAAEYDSISAFLAGARLKF